MKPNSLAPLRVAAGLAVLLACQAVAAQAVSVATRETVQNGDFLVGFATLGDSGRYGQTFSTPDSAFRNVAADSGGVNGFHGNTPVVGSGSFSTAQAYELLADRVMFSGSAVTTLSTPFSYVSTGANALSMLDLLLALPTPMQFIFTGELVELPGTAVNGLTARADAQVKLSGPGDTWLFTGAGAFVQQGVLDAGLWRINAFADTRGNGNASFVGALLLTPVPEPAAWLLLMLGVPALAWRRRAGGAR
jgi:hypothetical protein